MFSLFRFCMVLVFLAPTFAHTAWLENPSGGNSYSGIGVISGWKCEANGPLTIRFNDGNPIPLAYLNERTDTASVCGDANNGFVAIWNWANLGEGTHTAVVYDNGVEFGRSTFEVVTFGEEFVRGASGECTVQNFPSTGETTLLEWNEATQSFGAALVSVLPEMVVVPGGTFLMGAAEDAEGGDDERPQHQVTVPSFAVGKYEVTFDEWDACVAAGGCNGYRPDDEGWGRGRRPVIYVSWEDAQAYVAWLSEVTGDDYRLLSEAEWEYAARAGTTTRYWWGDEIGQNRANCRDCGSQWDGEQTAPVGSFEPNPFGLYDVHGNVGEWVQDCYNDNYQGAPSDGSAWETGNCGATRDIWGGQVVRSGWFDDIPFYLRSASRIVVAEDSRGDDFIGIHGFRVARTLP